MASSGNMYVAEVAIPAEMFTTPNLREPLPEPQYFGVVRGYWQVHFKKDHLGTERSTGLLVTVQLKGLNHEDAEDKSFALGEKMEQLVAFYAGSPVHPPLLQKLARVGASDGLLEQSEYFYLEDEDRLRQIEVKPYQLQKLLTRFGQLDVADRQHLELATRWYGISVSSTDSLDGYLAAWIGLESIGPMLDRWSHPAGPRAHCDVCGNTAEKRDRKLAGIVHIVQRVAPEALVSRAVTDLVQIRDRIAHGLKPADELRHLTDQLLPDLQASLAAGILTGADRSGNSHLTFSAFLPRDYQVRPDARATVRSDMELLNYRPYFGEWLHLHREFLNENSRLESDGHYIWGAGVRLRLEARGTVPAASPKPCVKTEYVMFQREGLVYRPLPSDKLSIPFVPWRNRPVASSWQRYRAAATGSASPQETRPSTGP